MSFFIANCFLTHVTGMRNARNERKTMFTLPVGAIVSSLLLVLLLAMFCNCDSFRTPLLFEPAHDKTYNKTCGTSKTTYRPIHPHSMASVPVHPSLDSLEDVEANTISEG